MRRALALALAPLAVACGGGASPDLPTVVLVTLDTTRADHLSTYGYGRPTDPFLADLARRSRVFTAAQSPATWTLPAHASMFSGLLPPEHGCYERADPDDPEGASYASLAGSTALLGEDLARAGYHGIGAVGGPFTAARYGFDRGFEAWLEPGDAWQLPGDELVAFVAESLDAAPADSPAFVFVNFFDAHAPHDPPSRPDWPFPEGDGDLPAVDHPGGRWSALEPPPPGWIDTAIDQYDRELLVQDEALAALWDALDARGRLDDALVVVTGDHGEAFGDNFQYGHGNMPFDAVARVPMVVHRTPGGPADRHDVPVSTVGVRRTVLAALRLPVPDAARGVDLLADTVEARPVWAEQRAGDEEWVVKLQLGRHAVWQALAGEAVDLAFLADLDGELGEQPLTEEQHGAGHDARLAELVDALERLRDGLAPPPADQRAAVLTEEEQRALDGLGY